MEACHDMLLPLVFCLLAQPAYLASPLTGHAGLACDPPKSGLAWKGQPCLFHFAR